MRFEVMAALAIGILLPGLKTCRRGISEWSVIKYTSNYSQWSQAGALPVSRGRKGDVRFDIPM